MNLLTLFNLNSSTIPDPISNFIKRYCSAIHLVIYIHLGYNSSDEKKNEVNKWVNT